MRVSYYGKPSQIYAKLVTAAVAKQYPLKKVRVVYDVTVRFGQKFTTKDRISTQFKSDAVYEAACPECNDKYIGKTCRHLKTRIYEHLLDQKEFVSSPAQPPEIKLNQKELSSKINNSQTGHMNTQSKTRMIEQVSSQRKLLPRPSSLPANNNEKQNNSYLM